MKLALAQLQIEPGAVEANLSRAAEAVAAAAADGADLVVLPEQFVVGFFAFDDYPTHAAGLNEPIFDRLAELAVENSVGLVAGTTVEDLAASAEAGYDVPADSGYANTAVFFDRDGDQRGVYRKHHLFGYESAESELLVPGERLDIVDFEGLKVGITTCYDLRFPELYRRLVDRGVELIVVPSAWPYPRVEHWKTLGRARAIENLCYVATTNGSGTFPEADSTLCGRSTVYDPWGTTMASVGDEPTRLAVEVDPQRVQEIRERFPALGDRRD
ncbi:putative amidohydrolase [Halohasta litchfieldiae]|jgi:predicted amidohydrolase|uniref:Predicted amidohydrolase n=1 Tax=Halohasta litchfieldiae TaxID=1073996 RepID=A0A1H6SIZ6_9EURY|nr:nitrilase-related carbon-nitrogen hydrolase [Halohasta litchfieldiae]ATW89910.1 putative amidohydrolase [Halohasta litchfieldiae]SEI66876.1 Predicted amidohydrolase [Halohasta litchfieldiae]